MIISEVEIRFFHTLFCKDFSEWAQEYKFIAFIFVFFYGWSMLNSLLKYKVTDKYTIDTFLMGPTELRIIICIFLLLEIFIENSLLFLGFGGSVILLIVNTADLFILLKNGDIRDLAEKSKK